jgi:phospholipase/carboxylesterase
VSSVPLDGPRLPPLSGRPAKSLVVFLHGYGADGNDLIDLGRTFAPLLPDTAFVAPHAPEPCAEAPAGRQWFPLALEAGPEHIARGVRQAAPALDAFLDAELLRHGLADPNLALVGFSQGTMMALHAGPRRPGGIAGIVGYSGFLAGADRLAEVKHRPPVLLVHGDEDPLIPVMALHAAVQALGNAGFLVDWHVCRGLAHGIDRDGLQLGGEFLTRVLSA